jgi:hypothetical protein
MLKAMQKLLQDDLHVPKEKIKIEEFTGYKMGGCCRIAKNSNL